MQWIRSLAGGGGSADFGFDIDRSAGFPLPGELYENWSLCPATRKSDAKAAAAFICSSSSAKPGPALALSLAQAFHRRTRTLRHPSLLAFLGGVELGPDGSIVNAPSASSSSSSSSVGVGDGSNVSSVTVCVSHVVPLRTVLSKLRKEHPASLPWGIFQVAKALSFLHQGGLVHGCVSIDAVFVDDSGDWKLGSLQLCVPVADIARSLLRTHSKLLVPDRIKAPEVGRDIWDTVASSPVHAVDSWSLAVLIWEVYTGRDVDRLHDLKDTAAIPSMLLSGYKELLASSPSQRAAPADLLEHAFFTDDTFVRTCQFLDEIALRDNFEKDKFFRQLDKQLDDGDFPQSVCQHKILPELVKALDFAGASSSVLGPLLKISRHLSREEFSSKVSPSVVKWFASPDRALRTQLLQNLDTFIHHFSDKTIDAEIFPHVATGFLDTAPALRELTVKSMLVLVPHISERTVNAQLLKHFAKLQMDPEAGIRTNTTICLAKLADHLSPATREKILVPAFSRALRDPFVRARVAGLISFIAVLKYVSAADVARRIIPAVAPLAVDAEPSVRDKAFEAIAACIAMLENHSKSMPLPTSSVEVSAGTLSGGFGSAPSTPAPGVGAGWLSSISSKLSGTSASVTSVGTMDNSQLLTSPAPSATTIESLSAVSDQQPGSSSSSLRLGTTAIASSSDISGGGWDDSAAWNSDDAGGDWDQVDAVLREEGTTEDSIPLDSGWDNPGGGWDDDDDFDFEVKPKSEPTALERRQQAHQRKTNSHF